MFWHFALLALAISLFGCGSAQQQQPRAKTGFKMYLKALRSPKPDLAYEMLSREQKQKRSYEDFALDWKQNESERLSQALEIERTLGTNTGAGERAIAEYKDGRNAALVRDPEGWRLESPFVPRSRAQTAQVAIEIFAAAITAQSFPALMQVLSTRQREGLLTQLNQFSSSLQEQLGSANHEIYHPTKDRAELAWSKNGIRYRVSLLNENGEWHIDDVHLGTDKTADPVKSDATRKSADR